MDSIISVLAKEEKRCRKRWKEIFICIKNDNKDPVVITRNEEPGMHHTGEGDQPFYSTYLVYSPDKAIAQLIPVAQPKTNSLEVSAEE